MANITASEIKTEAKSIIKSIFNAVTVSKDKDVWKKAFTFIDDKIYKLENWDRGLEMFAWREVKAMLNAKFGAKFITKK